MMRRKKRIEIPPKFVLVILSFICIVFMLVTLIFKDTITPLNTVSGYIFVPMQRGVNAVGEWISDRFENFHNNEELKKENEKLLERVNNLTLENKELKQREEKLEQYEDLYQLDQKYQGYSKVGANIIGSESSNWYHVFTINKGSKDGMKKDMNVIAGNGLVGIITEVGANYSTVKAIIDDTSKVSAMFVNTADNCFVNGDLSLVEEGYINVDQIDKDAQISDGDELVTSNVSEKFLPGITIGYISDIEVDPNNLTKAGKVTTCVDFKHLQTVLVITDLKEDMNEETND